MEQEIPKRFLHYQVASKLGEGKNGTVFEALDSGHQRAVVVKRLGPGFEEREDLKRMRRHSINSAIPLQHKNVLETYAVEEYQGTLLAITEHYDSETLRQRFDWGPVDPMSVLRIALEVAEGLDYVHRQGLRHGNLHPGNIMIDPRGEIKISDFGLPQHRRYREVQNDTNYLTDTLPYISPEEIVDDCVGQSADLYSLGVILFEALTGEVPFKAETEEELEEKILKEEPDIKFIRSTGVPGEIVLLVERLLSKRKEDRCTSASELIITIKTICQFEAQLEEQEETTDSSRYSPRTYLAISAIFVVLFALWSYLADWQ